MHKVFPGDRIEFELKTDDQGREYAAVTKLLSSSLKDFCGQCVQHGKAWFVEMDVARLNRKLFIPPPQRKGLKPGDWLQCQVARHPVKDGKGQANVRKNLGQDNVADFPSRYAAINFQLSQASCSTEDPTAAIANLVAQRPEQTELALASIDPPNARDIDDALFARKLDVGWEVVVAIADPTSVIELGSNTAKAANQRAATAYLPHQQLPMLAAELSENKLSLLEAEPRLAVLCRLQVAADGAVTTAEFSEACVRNRVQLSYAELEQSLENQQFADKIDEHTRQSLLTLNEATAQMRQWRSQHQLLSDDRPEFDVQLNTQGRIESLQPTHKGMAQRIVEECMLATNQAAARKLAGYGGLFNTHAGFRAEKLADATSLLQEAGFAGLEQPEQLMDPDTYRSALAYLEQHAEFSHYKNLLSRFLQRAELAQEALPHLGMGAASYLTFTSPLRRYVDFYNHVQLKRSIRGETPLVLTPQSLEQLTDALARLKAASYWADQWLKCEYLERQPKEPMAGRVIQANPFGVVVRLDANGIEGIVEKRAMPGKMKFSTSKLRFSSDALSIGLDDAVTVEVSSIRREKRQILFQLPGQLPTA
jgi:ribonuclease R